MTAKEDTLTMTDTLPIHEPDEAERMRRIRNRLKEHFAALGMREPRYRYFQRGNGSMFCWTVEPMNDGRYESFVYEPVGRGSRSGKAHQWKINESLTSRHKLRKDAKARAWRLFQEVAR